MPRWYAERDYDDPVPEPCIHLCGIRGCQKVALVHLTIWNSEGECFRAFDRAGVKGEDQLRCEKCQ